MGKLTIERVVGAATTELEKAVANWVADLATDYDDYDCEGPFKDLFHGGCSTGVVGHLTYYRDTCAFYEQHKEEIWGLVCDQVENIGHKNVFQFLAELGGANDVGSADQFENLMAWFGFEEAAQRLYDRLTAEEGDVDGD
jgi:hypothetical protein